MNTTNRPLRIAVADDDPRLRDYFQRVLSVLGHRVVLLAANGDELVAGCLDCQPDLVITDIHMPGLNGLEAVKRIWQTQHTPAILITGLPDGELLTGGRAQQALLYLVKPVPLVQLRQAIASMAA